MAIVADAASVGGNGLRVWQEAVPDQFANHRRHPAGAMIVLAEIFAGRLKIDQKRDPVSEGLPVVIRQIDAEMQRDGIEMDRRVGRPADGRIENDGVLKSGTGHDVGGFQIIPDHINDA